MKTLVYAIATLSAFMGATAAYLVKQGLTKFNYDLIQQLTNYKLILGILTYLIAFILFAIALKQAELSYVYPIMALTQIFVMIYAYYLLNEQIYVTNWIGVIFITIGLILTSIV